MPLNQDDNTGRQDIAAPEPTLEKSDPTPVDIKRGQWMVLGVSLVGVIFVIIAVLVVWNR
jgi:hypothetical protein